MNDQRSARVPGLGRWMIVAALLAAGLGLYFWYAPSSTPPAPVSAAGQ